jgi:chain length determinant protein tyrosine kinase EpsG
VQDSASPTSEIEYSHTQSEEDDEQIVEQFDSTSIGELLLEAGKITSQDAEAIMQLQKQSGLRFGDAALKLHLVNEADIQKALSKQFKFPYLTTNRDVSCQKLVAAYQPFGKQAEILRSVRSHLILKWFNDKRKALAVISPARNEGRSYFCANLAIVFSQLGAKTLLIDANLRQPKLHKLFKLKRKQGLSDLLGGRKIDGSIIFKSAGFNNLSIFPAGTIPPNPVELIGRGFKNCLRHLDHRFDVILIDTPAVELGVDAQIVAEHSGGALLVARQDKTQLHDLEAIKLAIESSGSVCVGAVINEFK